MGGPPGAGADQVQRRDGQHLSAMGKEIHPREDQRRDLNKKWPYVDIKIMESLQITDEAEMEAILEVITKSRYYDEDKYGSIPFMKAEWIAHNLAHSMATRRSSDLFPRKRWWTSPAWDCFLTRNA